jgi:hypothetical protein
MVDLLDKHHFFDFYSMDLNAISVHSDVFGELLQQFMPEVRIAAARLLRGWLCV